MNPLIGPGMPEVNAIFEFIASNEGLRLHAYWDVRRYSIGYGTISHAGETITQEEARNRAIEYIVRDYNRFIVDFPGCSLNQKKAMLDFAYQWGYGGMTSRLAHSIRSKDWSGIKHWLNAQTQYTSRRQKEADLL